MVQFAGRYRPANVTWYKDLDKGFLKPVEREAEKPQNLRLIRPIREESEELRIEGRDMLGRMANNLGIVSLPTTKKKSAKKEDITKKIY